MSFLHYQKILFLLSDEIGNILLLLTMIYIFIFLYWHFVFYFHDD